MFALILLEITTFIIYLIILMWTVLPQDENQNKIITIIHSSLGMGLNAFSIWILIVFGMHSMSFKITQRLLWFVLR
jgi:hypothetical protein